VKASGSRTENKERNGERGGETRNRKHMVRASLIAEIHKVAVREGKAHMKKRAAVMTVGIRRGGGGGDQAGGGWGKGAGKEFSVRAKLTAGREAKESENKHCSIEKEGVDSPTGVSDSIKCLLKEKKTRVGCRYGGYTHC